MMMIITLKNFQADCHDKKSIRPIKNKFIVFSTILFFSFSVDVVPQ